MNARRAWTIGLIALTVTVATTVAAQKTSRAAQLARPQATQAAAKTRVGVYRSRLVALAWERSKTRMKQIDALVQSAENARAQGDQRRLDALRAQIQAAQQAAHAQVYGDAPIPEVMNAIRGQLPGVASRAGVVAIVADVAYAGPDAEAVDVTDAVASLFHPDAKTRQFMDQLRAAKPAPLRLVAEETDPATK